MITPTMSYSIKRAQENFCCPYHSIVFHKPSEPPSTRSKAESKEECAIVPTGHWSTTATVVVGPIIGAVLTSGACRAYED
jgi:hypothetical protein